MAVVRTASEVAVEDTGLGPQGLRPGAGQDPSLGGRWEVGRGLPHGPCHQCFAVTLDLGDCPPGPALPRSLTQLWAEVKARAQDSGLPTQAPPLRR